VRSLLLLIGAISLAGCATQPLGSEAAAHRHAVNVAAAKDAGYTLVSQNGQTMFCSTGAPTGSHIAPGCLTEAEWEQRQLWVWHGTWCPIAAEACSQDSHSFISVSEPQ
jgi:hypothetical protein